MRPARQLPLRIGGLFAGGHGRRPGYLGSRESCVPPGSPSAAMGVPLHSMCRRQIVPDADGLLPRPFRKSRPPRLAARRVCGPTAGSRWPFSSSALLRSSTAAPPPATSPAPTSDAKTSTTPAALMQKSYFLSNGLLDRIAGRVPYLAQIHNGDLLPPHRRRQLARQARQKKASSPAATEKEEVEPAESAAAAAAATATPATAASVKTAALSPSTSDGFLPENASSILSDAAARQPTTSVRRMASSLLALAKPRLTVLVVLSAMAPYALYPVPEFVAHGLSAAPSSQLSPLTLLFLTTGTALCSASANALNMLYEPDTDARMSRTRNRPLVRMLVSRRAALAFAVACGLVGLAALHLGVNGTVAFLGGANIALYAGVYTPMKRLSVLNTWVGALVGGIPPLMGWAAAAGEVATGGSHQYGQGSAFPDASAEFRELLFAPDGSSAGGWLLASLLFAWQFPHFMAISWLVAAEYKKAGLRMLCWVHPARNARVALRYSLAYLPICVGLCATQVTEWSFAVTSLPINAWLVREAVRFWQHEGHHGSARGLFWASVWHLPAIMVLALLQKKGMWARAWRGVMGEPDLDEDDEDAAYYDGYDGDDDDEDADNTVAGSPDRQASLGESRLGSR